MSEPSGIVRLRGAVRVSTHADAGSLSLCDEDRTQVWLTGASASLPAALHGVTISAAGPVDASGPHRVVVASREGSQALEARALIVQRDAAAAFYGALPRVRVPLWQRAAWWLLPRVLRLPGIVRLLR